MEAITIVMFGGAVIVCLITVGYHLSIRKMVMRKVRNKNRKFGAATEYYHVRYNDKNYLFTHKELIAAQKRANENKEDWG
jgi:hypothetical protein